MVKSLKEKEIVENLKLLADWLRVKDLGFDFDEIHSDLAKKGKPCR